MTVYGYLCIACGKKMFQKYKILFFIIFTLTLDKINVKIKRYNITIKIFNKTLFDKSINV